MIVAENPENSNTEIKLEDAINLNQTNKDKSIGDEILQPLPSFDFGRIAAQTAKQVISFNVREAERERQFNDFIDKKDSILSGIVKRLEFGNVILDLAGTEAIIQGSLGYEAAERRELKGEAAKGDARSLLQEVGEIPPEISEAILENPAQVTAQVDTEPVEVQAAIAALPTEALVSSQMETLLADLDNGQTPVWAKPALEFVEQNLSQRGLNALFAHCILGYPLLND